MRGDLDPALVVAPIVAGMALCAYLMHVYTKAGLGTRLTLSPYTLIQKRLGKRLTFSPCTVICKRLTTSPRK